MDDGFGFEELDFTNLGIELRFDLAQMAKLFLRRRNHGVFKALMRIALSMPFSFTDLFDDPI